jgi:excisionase family DNA binding protein
VAARQIVGDSAEVKQVAGAGKSADSQEPSEAETMTYSIAYSADVTDMPESAVAGASSSDVAVGATARPTTSRIAPAGTAKMQGLHVLTAEEAALLLRVDVDVIIVAIGNGELPGNRIGSHWRVDQNALVRWLQGTYRNPVNLSGMGRPPSSP